jgi:hypothetical protein
MRAADSLNAVCCGCLHTPLLLLLYLLLLMWLHLLPLLLALQLLLLHACPWLLTQLHILLQLLIEAAAGGCKQHAQHIGRSSEVGPQSCKAPASGPCGEGA